MSSDKVLYPGAGCVVEFLHGNEPTIAFVLDDAGGKLRLYTENKREITLIPARLLPWSGPMRGANLSRHSIEQLLHEHKATRDRLSASLDILDVWELAQGEMEKANISWLSQLIWQSPTIDQEAALGRALLQCKTHFRFTPPDFTIYSEQVVEQRKREAESARVKEKIVGAGAVFFQTLWQIYQNKRGPLLPQEKPEPELAEHLQKILMNRMASPEGDEQEALWKQLTKSLPDHPRLALCLSMAWQIVPEHFNDLLLQADFSTGDNWAAQYTDQCSQIKNNADNMLDKVVLPFCAATDQTEAPLISFDPSGTSDRDDALSITENHDGSYSLRVALACPSLIWPFGSSLDKAIMRRASSIYLPEGDEHLLPPAIGWELFSLTEHAVRTVLFADCRFDATGAPQDFTLQLGKTTVARNFTLQEGEEAFSRLNAPAFLPKQTSDNELWQAFLDGASLDAPSPLPPLPSDHPTVPYKKMLASALRLSSLLQQQRIAHGAIITERPDPVVSLEQNGQQITVHIKDAEPTPLTHQVIGESMIITNALGAKWAAERNIPLVYRTQDVGTPKEFAGVWKTPQDIARVVKALPPTKLSTTPKRHAGLGLSAYTSFTAPIRRYVDLLNQGQIVNYLAEGKPLYDQEELNCLLPALIHRLDAVNQIQRMRPRYWKLLFFKQHGDKKWWPGVVTEESNTFVTIALPWAQLFVRGKRSIFSDKLTLGQPMQVRIGKVQPLLNEITIVEAKEADG